MSDSHLRIGVNRPVFYIKNPGYFIGRVTDNVLLDIIATWDEAMPIFR